MAKEKQKTPFALFVRLFYSAKVFSLTVANTQRKKMAKSNFSSTTGAAKKASSISLDELKNVKDPYVGSGSSPFIHDSEARFEGFAKVSWTSKLNGVDYSGEYLGLKFEGIKDALSLSTFIKIDEEAVDETNKFFSVQNDAEGVAQIMNKHSELTLDLLQEIESFFSSPRKFKLKPYKALTSWGKRTNRKLINIV